MFCMDYNTDRLRQNLIADFPKLACDPLFFINSPQTFVYNCIAFAMGLDDRWVSDNKEIPWYWWPDGAINDGSKTALKDAFLHLGFEECSDASLEKGYDKVALYSIGEMWTHAAKLVDEKTFHSKFGASNDALHSGGDTLDQSYGLIYCYMRRRHEKRCLSTNLKESYVGAIYTTTLSNVTGYPLVLYNSKIYNEAGVEHRVIGSSIIPITKV